MRVYSHATASFYTYLILILARTATSVPRLKQQDIVGRHFDIQRQKSDKTSPAHSRTVQLFSKNSGKFVQVLGRQVNASGVKDTDEVALVIETDTFGKVRIRHRQSNYYICMNQKGEIIGLNEKKGKNMKRCVFRYTTKKDGYAQFESDKYNKKAKRYLAFRSGGEPKLYTKVNADYSQRAIKFLMMDANPKKRNVKRNIRRRTIKHEFLHHEKHKERHGRRACLRRYLRCLRRNWKLKRRGQIKRIVVRCTRSTCRCKCAKQ